MHVPHGPYRISRNGQVVLGKDVLASAGLAPGDSVYLVPNDPQDGMIMVVPVEMAATWFEAGRTRTRGEPRKAPLEP